MNRLIAYRAIFLSFIVSNVSAMDSNVITIHPAPEECPTLKELACKKFTDLFDPHNSAISIDTLKSLKEKTHHLLPDLQEALIRSFHLHEADVLENMVENTPIRLSDKEVSGQPIISPNSEEIGYVAQKRNEDLSFNWPCDTMVLINMKTKKEQLIQYPRIGCKKVYNDANELTPTIIFSRDSNSVVFNSEKPNGEIEIIGYHIPTATMIKLATSSLKEAQPQMYDSMQKKLIIMGKKDDGFYSEMVDLDTKKHKQYPGTRLIYTDNIVLTHDTGVLAYNHDGQLIYRLSHNRMNPEDVAQIDLRANILVTCSNNYIVISDLTTGKEIRKIDCKNYVQLGEFINNNEITACSGSLPNVQLLRVNLYSGAYKQLMQNIYSSGPLNSDATLFFGSQSILYNSNFKLYHCPTQKIIKEFPDTLHHMQSALSPDSTYCLAKGTFYRSPADNLPYYYPTHRALTKGSTLSELLALLMIQKQINDKKTADNNLIQELATAQNIHLKDLAKKYKVLFANVS